MENIDFLPIAIKEKKFRRREQFLLVIISILTIINLITIYQGVRVNSQIKNVSDDIKSAKKPRKDKAVVLQDTKEINFIENNASILNGYEAISVANNKIIVKYNIEKEESFVEKIKEIENNKNLTIDYLVAPYKDTNGYMFEIGLWVSQ